MVTITHNSTKLSFKLYVINNGGPPLMGRTWIKMLKLTSFDAFNSHHYVPDENLLAKTLKDPEVFAEGLGTFKSDQPSPE